MMMNRSKYVNVRAAALLLLFVLAAGLSGCSVLADLVEDYVLVQVWNETAADADNSGDTYTCVITAEISNDYIVPLTAATVTLEMDEGAVALGLTQWTTLVSVEVGAEQTVSWTVRLPVEEADRNWDYSVTLASPIITDVSAFGSVFVDGSGGGNNRMVFSEDTWKFENYTVNSLAINAADYAALVYNLSETDKAIIEEGVDDPAGGQCFGMAVTSILAKVNRLDPADLQKNAAKLHDVSKNGKAKSMIASYYITQRLSYIQNELANQLELSEYDRLQRLIGMSESVEEGGTPVLLCYGLAQPGETPTSGHAVVAYGCEPVTYTHGDRSYSQRILIYDNNFTEFNEAACLYFDDAGNYTIPYWEDDGREVEIQLALNDISIMDRSSVTESKDSVYSFIVSRGTQSFILASEVIGEVMVAPSGISGAAGLIQLFPVYGDGTESGEVFNVAVKKTNGLESPVTVSPVEEGEALDLSVRYDGMYLSASAGAQDSMSFAPDGSVSVSGETEDFSISVTSDEGFDALGCNSFHLSGNSGENASLTPGEEGFILSGENLKGVEIRTEGESGESSMKLKSEGDEFLIARRGDTLNALVDGDGDGAFETVVATGKTSAAGNNTLGLFGNRSAVLIVLGAVGIVSLGLVILISTRSKY